MAGKPTGEDLAARVALLERELTESRQVEKALREGEERFRILAESAPFGLSVIRPDRKFEYHNPGFTKLFGYTLEEVPDKEAWFQKAYPDERLRGQVSDLWYADTADLLRTGGTMSRTFTVRCRGGEEKRIRFRNVPLRDGKTLLTYEDITAQEAAGEALRQSEKNFRELAELLPETIFETDVTGKLTFANLKAFDHFAYSPEDFDRGLNAMAMVVPEDRQRAAANFARVLSGEKIPGLNEYRALRGDGTTFPVMIRSTPIVRDGKTVGIRGFIIDITERKRLEESLREGEERYRKLYEECKTMEEVYQALLNSSPDAVIIYDLEGRAKYVCPAFTEIFGWERGEVEGKQIPYVPEPEKDKSLAISRELIDNGTPCHGFETKRFTKGGRVIDVSVSAARYDDHEGKPAGMLAIIRDISERKRLESQLLQAQKMEAIGTLAGGIAHDFNNILGAIMGYTELSLMDLSEGSRLQHNLKEVLKASHRAKDLVRQILAFSRQREQEKKPIHAHLIVKEALKLLQASLPKTIEIRERIAKEGDTIVADPGQVQQVLMNLCTNAHHAMAEKGGILEVTLVPEDLGTRDAGRYPDLGPGPYLRLTVSDTGHGMPPEILGRIFDPYFTTKQKGVGTGLGLAVVHGIVQSHGGAVKVESELGKGSTFHVLFPRVQMEAEAEIPQVEPLPMGQERILLVDDEEALVDIAAEMLRRLGYDVVSRTSPVEALGAFRADPQRFDLVITDQTMPNMTGSDLSRELIRIRPDIPIILCTGYSETVTEEKAKATGIREFVLKPVVMRQLAVAIRKALGRAG